MTQLVLTVPTVNFDDATVVVTLVLIGAALFTTIAYEVIKRRYTAKQLKDLGLGLQKRGKVAVAVIMTGLATLFTTLGYLLFIADEHVDFLTTLPFVGKHVPAVLGTGWLIYNLRLNVTYQNVANVLNKWTTRKTLPETELVLDGIPEEPLA